jgi:hypothetical protein
MTPDLLGGGLPLRALTKGLLFVLNRSGAVVVGGVHFDEAEKKVVWTLWKRDRR